MEIELVGAVAFGKLSKLLPLRFDNCPFVRRDLLSVVLRERPDCVDSAVYRLFTVFSHFVISTATVLSAVVRTFRHSATDL